MKLFRNAERGQALIIIAIAAVALFGFIGLAVDGSLKFSDRRHAQNAADTAALAAALAKEQGWEKNVSDISSTTGTQTSCPPPAGTLPSDLCSALLNAGKNRAQDNGYNNDGPSNTVQVYSPPISGYYATAADKNNYVQVIITSHVQTTFMRILGITKTDNIVQATAYVKRSQTLGSGSMLVSYDPQPSCNSGSGNGGTSFYVGGSPSLYLNGGGIFINSQATCGYYAPHCPDLTITGAAGINSAGTVDNINQPQVSATCINPPAPEYINQTPILIPSDISFPPVPPECDPSHIPQNPDYLGLDTTDSFSPHHGEYLIYPGYYTDFPQAGLVSNRQHIYMASGVYCIDAGGQTLSWSPVDFVSLNGSTDPSINKYASKNPTGVTLYLRNSKGFTINANNPTYFDGTTLSTSDYQGYLMIVEGTPSYIQGCSIQGGANVSLNGMIFAPYCSFILNGSSGINAAINAQILGWDFTINGDNAINFNYNPAYKVVIKRKIGLMK